MFTAQIHLAGSGVAGFRPADPDRKKNEDMKDRKHLYGGIREHHQNGVPTLLKLLVLSRNKQRRCVVLNIDAYFRLERYNNNL